MPLADNLEVVREHWDRVPRRLRPPVASGARWLAAPSSLIGLDWWGCAGRRRVPLAESSWARRGVPHCSGRPTLTGHMGR